jgi:hypothetical protein
MGEQVPHGMTIEEIIEGAKGGAGEVAFATAMSEPG